MSDAELTAAAERLREYLDAGGEFEVDRHEPEDWMDDWRENYAQNDLWDLARAYMRLHDPRPLADMTAEEWEAEGWQRDGNAWEAPTKRPWIRWHPLRGFCMNGTDVPEITTLGQLRRLTGAIGQG